MSKSPALLRSLARELPAMVSTLRRYVECESPSGVPEAVEAMAELVAGDFATLGAKIRRHRLAGFGPALEIRLAGVRRAPRILLLGHIDTVYPLGTLKTMPWREQRGKLCGPGAFDMKAGIVQAFFALKFLQKDRALPCPVTLLLVPDEEIGSPASRVLTEKLAREAAAVLVLEPSAGANGAAKTSRKGIARYTLRVHGKAAHSGLDFERGASAIVEAAHQVTALAAMCHPEKGLTINPGIVTGGTRSNVVADLAEIVLDVRFLTARQAQRVDADIRKLRPRDARCSLELSGGVERAPFERSKETARLYRLAAGAAESLGFALEETSVGGASDGNLTAALGIPTLDGLGAVGDGAHAASEFVLARQMPCRAALLAELITTLAAV